MTKTLFLVRHAQAAEAASSDLYRPLTSSGMIDTARMAVHLSAQLQGIDLLISSNAERARMTATIFMEELHLPDSILKIDESIYESSPKHYLKAVNDLPEEYNKVMLVGHNPTISFFAEYLCHDEFGSMPTAGVIGISFENQTWAEISKRTGKTLFYDSPDSLIGYKLD